MRSKPSKWPDLNQFTLLHVLLGDNQRYLTWQHWLKAAGIDGLGITIADPHMIAHELANGQLVRVLNVHVYGHPSYWLVTRREQGDLPHVAVFREWLRQEVWLTWRSVETSAAR